LPDLLQRKIENNPDNYKLILLQYKSDDLKSCNLSNQILYYGVVIEAITLRTAIGAGLIVAGTLVMILHEAV